MYEIKLFLIFQSSHAQILKDLFHEWLVVASQLFKRIGGAV